MLSFARRGWRASNQALEDDRGGIVIDRWRKNLCSLVGPTGARALLRNGDGRFAPCSIEDPSPYRLLRLTKDRLCHGVW